MTDEREFADWTLPIRESRHANAWQTDLSSQRICLRCGVAVFPDWVETHQRWHAKMKG